MTVRVCIEGGCPTLTRSTRCHDHERARDKARGTTTDRGYGAEHQAKRAELAPIVATGRVKCWRCGEYINSSEAWDLGHDDDDRTKYRGPEHAGRCNRATSGRISPRA